MLEKERKLRVVLVDDDADDRALFEEAFSESRIGSSLSLFRNGAEFVDYLDLRGTDVPDIVFLDLNMPLMGGMETLRQVRSSTKYGKVPIAIYSTSGNEKDITETLALGANIYIVKPNDFRKLQRTLDHVLRVQWQYATSALSLENFVMVIE